MQKTRRNVLVGLGGLTIGGGLLFGTGAFSQVEAQRTVDVDTSTDGEAQLNLEIIPDSLDGGGDTIEFNEQDLNMDAITRYDGALRVATDDGSELTSVDIQAADESSLVVDNNAAADDEVLYFEVANDSLGTGEITYDVVFDTTNGDIGGAEDPITIVAQS